MTEKEVDHGELPHLDQGADELVGSERFYHDGGAAYAYLRLREYERDLARRLNIGHLSELNGCSGDVRRLMQGWHSYNHMLGGEHYGPVSAYAENRILLYGDALAGRLPANGIKELSELVARDPSYQGLSGDDKARYEGYSRELGQLL